MNTVKPIQNFEPISISVESAEDLNFWENVPKLTYQDIPFIQRVINLKLSEKCTKIKEITNKMFDCGITIHDLQDYFQEK